MSATHHHRWSSLAALIETLAAYISRVYSEFGKILSREVQDNLDDVGGEG